MDETIMNTVEEQLEGQTTMFGDEVVTNNVQSDAAQTDDALKDAIDAQLKKIQRQNMLIGAQTICTVVLEKIVAAMKKPGKRTMNDYKRLIKDIEQFCRTGLSRNVNSDGETEPVDGDAVVAETIQN